MPKTLRFNMCYAVVSGVSDPLYYINQLTTNYVMNKERIICLLDLHTLIYWTTAIY